MVGDVPREKEAGGALTRAIDYSSPPRIESVQPGLPGDRARLKPGDLVVRANGATVESRLQFTRIIRGCFHRPVEETEARDCHPLTFVIVPERRYGLDPPTRRAAAYVLAAMAVLS